MDNISVRKIPSICRTVVTKSDLSRYWYKAKLLFVSQNTTFLFRETCILKVQCYSYLKRTKFFGELILTKIQNKMKAQILN